MGNTSDVLRLLQCALTPTIHIRTGLSTSQQAAWSIQMSTHKVAETERIDSFVIWSQKAWVAIGMTKSPPTNLNQTATLKAMSNMHFTFGHMALNKAMVAAAEKVMDPTKVNAKSLDVINLIEVQHGRDVFSTGYTKLKKLADLCGKAAAMNNESSGDYVHYCLDYLLVAGEPNYISLTKLTADTLDIGKDGKTNRYVLRCLSQRELVHSVIKGWVSDLPNGEDFASMKAEMLTVISTFETHLKVYRKFNQADKKT